MPHLKTRKNNLVRTAVLFGVSVVALLGAAPAADAATVGYSWWGSTAYYYAAPGEANVMEKILDCARAYATEGEIRNAMREVFGDYVESAEF